MNLWPTIVNTPKLFVLTAVNVQRSIPSVYWIVKPKCAEIKNEAPETIAYLSTESKAHFKEVLEYLDSMEINYTISSTLVRGPRLLHPHCF